MYSRLMIAGFCLIAFSGCEQTRSFLHMDSNSGSPFMGLQFSVDAKETNGSNPARSVNANSTELVSMNRSEQSVTTMQASLGQNHQLTGDFVNTSESQPSTGNLKYSLPVVNLAENPREAAEVDEIMTRI